MQVISADQSSNSLVTAGLSSTERPIQPLLKGIRVIGAYPCNQFSQQEQGNAGVLGHGSWVTVECIPAFSSQQKTPPLLTGPLIFSREIDSENHAACFPLRVFLNPNPDLDN